MDPLQQNIKVGGMLPLFLFILSFFPAVNGGYWMYCIWWSWWVMTCNIRWSWWVMTCNIRWSWWVMTCNGDLRVISGFKVVVMANLLGSSVQQAYTFMIRIPSTFLTSVSIFSVCCCSRYVSLLFIHTHERTPVGQWYENVTWKITQNSWPCLVCDVNQSYRSWTN